MGALFLCRRRHHSFNFNDDHGNVIGGNAPMNRDASWRR
jgi:hypothetical protein